MARIEVSVAQARKFVGNLVSGRRSVTVAFITKSYINGMWDSGSRDTHTFLRSATRESITAAECGFVKQTFNNPFNAMIGDITPPSGTCVVITHTSGGKTPMFTILVPKDDAEKVCGILGVPFTG